jgi:hypothetical protein
MAVVFTPVISRCQLLNSLRNDWTPGSAVLDALAARRTFSSAEQLNPAAILNQLSDFKRLGLVEDRIIPESSPDALLASREFRLTPAGEMLKKELCPDDYSGCCS